MPIRNTLERWGSVAKFFHWAIVVLVVTQFVLAFIAEDLPLGMQKLAVLARHKSVGITILVLATLRLLWRAANRSPGMPAGMAGWEKLGARAAHALLYALLFAVPLAGWIMSSAKNFPVSWFGLFQLPDLVAPSEATFDIAHEAHEILAFTLGGVATLHLLAALKHHFINRDSVLRRMLPFARVPIVAGLLVAGGSGLGDALAAAPGAGTWTGSAASGRLEFRFRQAGAATSGAFGQFTVQLVTAADGIPTRLSVVVDTGSIDTQDKDRDSALRSSDLFDVKKFPRASFEASHFKRTAEGRYEGTGTLTIRDTAREVALPFTLAPTAGAAVGWRIAGDLPIKRLDYGVGQGEMRSTDFVDDAVTVSWSVVLGLPLGIGKPNLVANEFYRRAARDPTLRLTILTALSLARPRARNDLERRLLEPIVERVFADYPELDYVLAARAGTLPPNIEVIEFFFEPGAWLGVDEAQQHYLSANYTHVARDFLARGANVIAQLVAKRTVAGEAEYSLGSNPDVTVDLLPQIDAARAAGRDIVLIGAVHPRLPFMFGSACVDARHIDYLIDHPRYDYELYCPPNLPLRTVDHAIAMHASALVRDGGTLQIGIGELGDALVYALLLRHQQNGPWRAALEALGGSGPDTAPFRQGLYACSEMLVDQMLDLLRTGILRRHAYPSLPLMRLLAQGRIEERFDATVLEALVDAGVARHLDAATFDELRRCGVFRADTRYRDGQIRGPEGGWITADLGDAASRLAIATHCLGRELQGGVVAHAAFFLGPRGFYAKLRDMPERERRRIDMCGVGFVNQLYGADYELRCLQRRDARFVNTAMMVTLLGAAVSDTLEDGRVVSGVGGQYNFVSMAHALPGARAVMCLRATREKAGRVTSNIVWNYGQATVPRHLRDLVVTEYGVADLRSATDAETIARLLDIADSRFQPALLAQAQAAGKIARDYRIPAARQGNTPERLDRAFAGPRQAGLFSDYPFGTDLTQLEIRLAKALGALARRTATRSGRLRALAAALRQPAGTDMHEALARMGLAAPKGWRERLARRLVALALRDSPS